MPGRRPVLVALVAILLVAGLGFLVLRPIPPASVAVASPGTSGGSPSSPHPSAPSTTATGTRPSSTCRVGDPKRLVIRALDVNAPFERIGLDEKAAPDAQGRQPLGTPKDRTKAGWYAAGPRPGSGTGTVLTNGHTFRNDSAIFKEDFAARVAVGQRIDVRMDNGSVCSYAVSRVWRDVPKTDYPHLVTSQHLYDFSGPERLFLTTCGGSWNSLAQNYDDNSLVIATPVNRT
ncbi:hypothetical protein GCM10027053_09990 [Intrasporangium mesophilum]